MKKRIMIIVALLVMCWAGVAWGADYWVYNASDSELNLGTEKDPFLDVDTCAAVVANGEHTIHIKGSYKPYKGGIGGQSLPLWQFGNCTIVKNESKLPVVFYAQRTIPLSAMTAISTDKYSVKAREPGPVQRWVKKGETIIVQNRVSQDLEVDKGISYDKITKTLQIDAAQIVSDTKEAAK